MADQKLIASLATPIAIVIAGVIVAGAVFYTNRENSNNSNSNNPSVVAEGSKYQKFIQLAESISLDAEAFGQCMEKFDTNEIKADLAAGGSAGINGTPGFLVGKTAEGTFKAVKIAGAYPFENFKMIIDGLTEGNDQQVLDGIGPDRDGNRPASMEEALVDISIDDDPILGDPNAPITIVEFSDYECPFCQRHFNTTHSQLMAEYINTGKARLVFRDFPLNFHDPVATQAAVAANCAREQGGDEAYYKYHDEYFTQTKSNGEGL